MELTWTDLGGPAAAPLLVVGPSIGTGTTTLWGQVAERVSDVLHVVGWELPGHAGATPGTGFSIADLADAVAASAPEREFHYAGDSIGGAVGLRLLLDHADRVRTATLLSTGARILRPTVWRDRAALVRADGIGAVVATTPERWFAHPDDSDPGQRALVDVLATVDPESYAAACEALGGHDVRHQLADISTPVLAVAGEADVPTPPADLRRIADGVQQGRYAELTDAAHLPPFEQPDRVAALLREQVIQVAEPRRDLRADGMRVRREVLGDAHVDRASASITDLTADYQEMITRYAWGEIWTRPGLDRRSRSMITLTALIARGHHDELAMHLRAARRNGLSDAEIREVLLQSAIYCGVPDANTAFRIAQQVLAEPTDQEDDQ